MQSVLMQRHYCTNSNALSRVIWTANSRAYNELSLIPLSWDGTKSSLQLHVLAVGEPLFLGAQELSQSTSHPETSGMKHVLIKAVV